MKRRYFYSRVTRRGRCPAGPVELVAGVETLPWELVTDVYERAKLALAFVTDEQLATETDQALANLAEIHLKQEFADDRSYFLEIGRGELDEYVQVYTT